MLWGRGEFKDTCPAGHVQPPGFLPEHDCVVDRYDRGLFSHESGRRPPIDGAARGPCSDCGASTMTVLTTGTCNQGTPTALQRLEVGLAFDIDSLFEVLNSTVVSS